MMHYTNDPPVYPPTTGEEPIASPAPVYPIPVWGTPEAAPTETVSVVGLPGTGAGDTTDDYSFGLDWQVAGVLLVLLGIAAVALLYRRRK